ncbi:MAG TPA: hypothetical protein VIM59_20040 [Cellvibrio sp.]
MYKKFLLVGMLVSCGVLFYIAEREKPTVEKGKRGVIKANKSSE